MKKMLSLLLAAVLVLACIGVSAADDVSGTWYVTEASQGDIKLDPATIGIEMTLTLNPDGTAALSAMGQDQACAWTLNADNNVVLTADGQDIVLNYDGTSLTLSEDGIGFKFERNAGEAFKRPADAAADSISAFNGSWTAVKAGVAGMYVDMSVLASFGLELNENALNFVITDGVLTAPDTDPQTLTFADGALSGEIPGLGEEPSAVRVLLLEGDMIEIEIPAIGFSFICARTEAAQQAA